MNKPERPQPTIQVRLFGNGIHPENVGVSNMAKVVQAIQVLANTDLRLTKVRRGSACYQLTAHDPTNAETYLHSSGKALEEPANFLKFPMLHAFDSLQSIIKQLGCSIEIKSLVGDWNWTLKKDKWTSLRKSQLIRDEATVYGNLQRVGGATERKCCMRVPDRKRLLFCLVNDADTARKLGRHLYKNVTLRGYGLFFIQDWTLLKFTVDSFVLHKPMSVDEMRKRVREAGGDAWDRVQNPIAELEDMR